MGNRDVPTRARRVKHGQNTMVARGEQGKWQPGSSGNPNGRPPVNREFIAKVRNFMDAEGWDILVRTAKNTNDDNWLKAMQLIVQYAYGRPSQHMEVTGMGGGAVRLAVVYEDSEGDKP